MYHLAENFGCEHRWLVDSDKHINHVLEQKKILNRQIMSLRHMAISKITFGMSLIVQN